MEIFANSKVFQKISPTPTSASRTFDDIPSVEFSKLIDAFIYLVTLQFSLKNLKTSLPDSTIMSTTSVTVSEATFHKQIALAREALLNFSIISQLNAPGPIKLATEELINITVRCSLFLCTKP